MVLLDWIAGITALLLFVYLIIVLFYPDRFS